MADPSNDEKFDKGKLKQTNSEKIGSSSGQPIGGNDGGTGSGTPLSQGAEFGGEVQTGSGSEPPRSMGTRGTEFGQFGDATGPAGQQGQSGTGQADLGIQADATLAGRSDQQDLGPDQPGGVPGATGRQGEGFMAQERESPSSAKATDGSDFARQGRGAAKDDEQVGSNDNSD